MTKVHHATVAKAESLGFIIEANRVFNPSTGTELFGEKAKDLVNEMSALLTAKEQAEEAGIRFEVEYNEDKTRVAYYLNGHRMTERADLPTKLLDVLNAKMEAGINPADEQEVVGAVEIPGYGTVEQGANPAEAGVGPDAEDTSTVEYARKRGATDYAAGVVAADCPYDNESEDANEAEQAEAWYEGWDAAADASETEEEDRPTSVVADKYRAIYKEAGHPDNCGDWLAQLMDDICVNEAGTNMELFEAICDLNGIDLSKYNRTSRGWQGRLRMTGRNLLARKVFLEERLILPETLTPNEGGIVPAPADWLATRPYKRPKAKAA